MHPAFRGRGYTTRALRLLSDVGVRARPASSRLELGAKVANIASQKAARRRRASTPDGIGPSRLRNPDGTFSDEARFA